MTRDDHEAVLNGLGAVRRLQLEAERETVRQIKVYVTGGPGACVPASEVHRLTGVRRDTVDRWRAEHRAAPAPVPAQPLHAGPKTSTEAVRDLVLAAGRPLRQKDIVSAMNVNKGTVSKAVGRLIELGHLVRFADGAVGPPTQR